MRIILPAYGKSIGAEMLSSSHGKSGNRSASVWPLPSDCSATRTRPGGKFGASSRINLPSACNVPSISIVFAIIDSLRERRSRTPAMNSNISLGSQEGSKSGLQNALCGNRLPRAFRLTIYARNFGLRLGRVQPVVRYATRSHPYRSTRDPASPTAHRRRPSPRCEPISGYRRNRDARVPPSR